MAAYVFKSSIFAIAVIAAPLLLMSSSIHQVNAQAIITTTTTADQIKLIIPDYKMTSGASITRNMTIVVATNGAATQEKVTISNIDFAYHREWLKLGKELPFNISYDPSLKCICTTVPITVTLPQDTEGARDIPVTVIGISEDGATQMSSSSSLLIFPETSTSVGEWSVVFVSTAVPISAAAIGIIFVYKRLLTK